MDSTRPVYAISVAAELAGMHPQTLRQYDRLGLMAAGRLYRAQAGKQHRMHLEMIVVQACDFDGDGKQDLVVGQGPLVLARQMVLLPPAA